MLVYKKPARKRALQKGGVAEMHRRYEILEHSRHKSIDPERDELDLIVVGIDEAAALLGRGTNETARNCMGELARLARAAGIHLIAATQKHVKEAISTEILDNLTGRMTFRMISTAASNVAMGGNYAHRLRFAPPDFLPLSRSSASGKAITLPC